jgi:hypothetical protein
MCMQSPVKNMVLQGGLEIVPAFLVPPFTIIDTAQHDLLVPSNTTYIHGSRIDLRDLWGRRICK